MTTNRTVTAAATFAITLIVASAGFATTSFALCHSPVSVHAAGEVVFTKRTRAGARRLAKRTWKRVVHEQFGRQFSKFGRSRNRSGSYRVDPRNGRFVYEMTATPCD